MKYSIDLSVPSKPEWLEVVMSDFNAFLQDHANCERKASAMAMSFVAKYPDRVEILPELIDTAIEELEHFKMVYEVMEARHVPLKHEIEKDWYVQGLLKHCRTGREDRLLDRLLLASVLECRGAERFRLVAEALQDDELQKFYKMLWTSEAKHGNIFVKMALNYYEEDAVYQRLDFLVEEEGKIINDLTLRPALH